MSSFFVGFASRYIVIDFIYHIVLCHIIYLIFNKLFKLTIFIFNQSNHTLKFTFLMDEKVDLR